MSTDQLVESIRYPEQGRDVCSGKTPRKLYLNAFPTITEI
jgi:hypothetical protein